MIVNLKIDIFRTIKILLETEELKSRIFFIIVRPDNSLMCVDFKKKKLYIIKAYKIKKRLSLSVLSQCCADIVLDLEENYLKWIEDLVIRNNTYFIGL